MKKAVMYGAGNIGRGFIGAVFSKSGYEVTFIDVNKAVVNEINDKKKYPVRILKGDTYEDTWVEPVNAVDGSVTENVVKAITEADIMATAVGVNILKFIAEPIAMGLIGRWESGVSKPLDIILCENLIGADSFMRNKIGEYMDDSQKKMLNERVGFVEASIGRMVPVQTPEMQDGNMLRVCVEEYSALPVDSEAFKGGIPELVNLVPYSPFDYYISRKLFIHNMGHAMTAYLGSMLGCDYIYEAIAVPEVEMLVMRAMLESSMALSQKYDVPFKLIYANVEDLLRRFANRQLKDTVARVGGDIKRKLSPNDRIIGALKLCCEQDVEPLHICLAAAAAMHFKHDESSKEPCDKLLTEISGLERGDKWYKLIKEMYDMLGGGASLSQIMTFIKGKRTPAKV